MVNEFEYLAKRIVEEGMKKELLREDERRWFDDGNDLSPAYHISHVHQLCQRLIEERERSVNWQEEARRYCQNVDYWTAQLENAETELAEERKKNLALQAKSADLDERQQLAEAQRIYKAHNDGRECLCPYCCVFRPATKEG